MTSNTRICNYYTYSHYPSIVFVVFIIIMDSDITLMIRHKLTECYTYIKHLS